MKSCRLTWIGKRKTMCQFQKHFTVVIVPKENPTRNRWLFQIFKDDQIGLQHSLPVTVNLSVVIVTSSSSAANRSVPPSVLRTSSLWHWASTASGPATGDRRFGAAGYRGKPTNKNRGHLQWLTQDCALNFDIKSIMFQRVRSCTANQSEPPKKDKLEQKNWHPSVICSIHDKY